MRHKKSKQELLRAAADPVVMFDMYQSGMTQPEIATKLGITQSRVSIALRNHPLWSQRRKRKHRPYDREERKPVNKDDLARDYNSGMTVSDLQRKYDISPNTIKKKLAKSSLFEKRSKTLHSDVIPIVNGMRRCKTCNAEKPLSQFSARPRAKYIPVSAHCATCDSRLLQESRKREYKALRDAVLVGYGNRCASCSFSDPRALHIDHVNDDGNYERRQLKIKSYALLRRIIRNGFPPEYQLLCANCNTIKAHESGKFSAGRRRHHG